MKPSPEAYDLDRKAPMDQERHQQKVRDAIKGNLKGIVGEESLISSDGKKIVKIPIRELDLPDFRFGSNNKGVGQGDGGTEVGDVIGRIPGSDGQGRGPGAGQEPGVDYYEAEITVDELAALVFEDLGLPFLLPKGGRMIPTNEVRFDEKSSQGLMPNLDKKGTILRHLKRKAMAGERKPKIGKIRDDDLLFRIWETKERPVSQAAVIAMRDVSGSMGEFEKYISRSFYLWMVRFLRTKYNEVEIVFITHHTEAKEVDEPAFFNLGESGGTKVSSAYQLADEIVDRRFPVADWNIYPFHFSDGDNWGDVDNQRCLELVERLLGKSNAFGYGEIQQGGRRSLSTLMSVYGKIKNPRFIAVTIKEKNDVYGALKEFFKQDRMLASEFSQ